MATSASEILGRIENDAVFAGFLEAGFDPAQFASKIVRADVGKANAAVGGSGGAHGAAPVLQLQEGGDGIGSGSGGGGVGVVTSAESVSSQAEITLDSMSSHIARIESAIQQHILDNEEDFLGSVGGVTELSRRTDEFRDGVRELRRSFARVQREVSEPHEAIRLRTQQLKNLHAATRLLKRALRFLAALRRLRAQEGALGLDAAAAVSGSGAAGAAGRGGSAVADLGELAKAAQSLQELEGTLRDPEVSELEVVGRERAYVETCGAAVRRMAADALARGMKGLNQTDAGGALQVFFNLECLAARVKACVTHLAGEAEDAVSDALQPAALADATSSSASSGASEGGAATTVDGVGGSEQQRPLSPPPPGGAGGGGGAAGRRSPSALATRRAARMRAHAGKLAAALHGTSMEAWGLQRVLDKKRDPTSRALLDATVRADRSGGGGGGVSLSAGAYRAYWDGLCRAVRGAVDRALEGEGVASGGGGGGVALVAMYPFLRKAFLRLMRRLEEGTAARSSSSHRGSGVGERSDGVGGGGAATAAGRPGILGGSRWLSMALDAEFDDELSLDSALNGGVGGGAEAGAGPVSRIATSNGGSSRGRVFGRRGGKGNSGGAAGGAGGGGSGGGDGSGDSGSDGARLLEALGPLRDLFLARSLDRLTTPVEQMFPQFDGYTAAVPSKHDLASFVRSIHAELALAVPTGSTAHRQGASTAGTEAEAAGGGGGGGGSTDADLSLLPLLLKGVVQAAKLFCAKAEAMRSVEEGAYKFGGNSGKGRTAGTGGGMMDDDPTGAHDMSGMSSSSSAAVAAAAPMEAWAPTTEQEHNLQLLELVVKLRDALLGIPALVIPPPYPTNASPPPGPSSAPYGAGGEAAAAAAATAAAASDAEAETSAVFGRECRERVEEAVRALDETSERVFLEPYLSGVAGALEAIVAKMHRENFGPGASSSTAAMATGARRGSTGGGGSLFLLELQGALAALQADHFARIAALRTPCAEAALRSLAGRVLRAYVTHCALVRPLSEEGKAKVAQDMATLEIALSPLARVSELGAVYQESRAFRTLLFVDDAEDDEGMDEGTGPAGGGRSRDSRSFLTEACMAHLRPTSVWHYLFSRAPDELSSPHVSRGMSEQAYVSWLLGGGAAEEGKAREENGAEAAGGDGAASTAYTERSFLSPDTSYMAEVGAWGVIQACLDEYHQRRSATNITAGTTTKQEDLLPRAVMLLPEAGPALLSAYESRAGTS